MFLHSECPPDKTFIEFVKSQIDWDKATTSVENSSPVFFLLPICNPEDILFEVHQLYREIGFSYWRSQQRKSLYGMSLSYNPAHPREDWRLGSFGHERYQQYTPTDYFTKPAQDSASAKRDDYLDSYGFRRIIPEVSRFRHLSALLKSFHLPVVRVTVRTVDGTRTFYPPTAEGGMHKDDSVFEVLRVNICLSTNDNFGLQYSGEQPIFPNPGDVYVVNSDRMHRVYVKGNNNFQRTHIVIGLAPWMSYDSEHDGWDTNEYFGKVHPLRMAHDGLIRSNT